LVISDGGPHFIDKSFKQFLAEYGVKHNIGTPYLPKQAVRLKHQISKSRTFYKRPWMKWGRNGSTSFVMHFGHIELHTKHP
jgi:transposase InsO family protein